MTVGRACTRIVVTAHPEETVLEVAQRMAQYDVGMLVIIEAQRPVGVITDRDLVIRVMAKELNPEACTIRMAMTDKPVCISEHTALEDAIALMRGYQIRRLVVINDTKELVGVLSLDDLLLLLGEEQQALAGLMRTARSRLRVDTASGH